MKRLAPSSLSSVKLYRPRVSILTRPRTCSTTALVGKERSLSLATNSSWLAMSSVRTRAPMSTLSRALSRRSDWDGRPEWVSAKGRKGSLRRYSVMPKPFLTMSLADFLMDSSISWGKWTPAMGVETPSVSGPLYSKVISPASERAPVVEFQAGAFHKTSTRWKPEAIFSFSRTASSPSELIRTVVPEMFIKAPLAFDFRVKL
mmetsp:Transcript_28040/g.73997  ORF Transcript_28040/g.73997 Transcript_28040/m.73997 type:complete len:203 (+) Transcript_28040:828-1436(+)